MSGAFTPTEAALVGLVVLCTAGLTALSILDPTAAIGLFSSVLGYVFRAVSRAGVGSGDVTAGG